ncbi:cation diffusion facilitator family transporter [Actinomadura sp. KC216]|uniref:cation diffusion facilitator family transporter n=1 Tax=Actinomadura sp. KC216 TaxID=2530370 RepID=UPI001FB6DB13|nr:cation diffusion facilitator family transporter [Actinomadura sp. KC216]
MSGCCSGVFGSSWSHEHRRPEHLAGRTPHARQRPRPRPRAWARAWARARARPRARPRPWGGRPVRAWRRPPAWADVHGTAASRAATAFARGGRQGGLRHGGERAGYARPLDLPRRTGGDHRPPGGGGRVHRVLALLGDTLHNAADALTAVPLGIAFILGRRPPTRRYTYGYGRAEDLAGVIIVLAIAASATAAGYAAVQRLAHPQPVDHVAAVAGAALVGFVGNELVARYRIRVGRRIGSAALVADGLHARTDGFASLAVLLGAAGIALGAPWADPVVGLLITLAILTVLWQTAREVGRRLMDAVDPALVDRAEAALSSTPGVLAVGDVRLRWIGHRLRAECDVVVDPASTVVRAHQIAVDAEHSLLHALPRLSGALVHPDPQPRDGEDHHAVLAGHR